MLKTAVLTIILALDLASYCKGYCRTRYADGTFSKDKNECACTDYFTLNLDRQIETPKKRKPEFEPPGVYYGADEMHYPVPDSY